LNKKYGDYVLIATSFVWEKALPSAAFIGQIYSSFGKEYEQKMSKIIAKGIEDETDTKNYQKLLQVISAILKETDYKIIIRPHPMESKENAENIEKYSSRIIVKSGGPSTPLVAGASIVVHMGSTISVEAKGMGIKVIHLDDAYKLIDSRRPIDSLWNLHFSGNSEDLVSSISVREFCDQFADECLDRIIVNSSTPRIEKMPRSFKGIIGTYLHRPRFSKMSQFDNAKRPSTTRAEASLMKDKAISVLKSKQEINLRMIGKSTFELLPKKYP
jgi:hypothetical protein